MRFMPLSTLSKGIKCGDRLIKGWSFGNKQQKYFPVHELPRSSLAQTK
jgi:hypothetical protein